MSSETKKLKGNMSYYIHSAIGVLIMVLFRFIPPIEPMTSLGMEILGIFIGVLYLWIATKNLGWTSFLALILVGMSDYFEGSLASAINGILSNASIQMSILMMVIGALITSTDVASQLANRMISSRWLKGHPWRLSAGILFVVFFCSLFRVQVPSMLICWSIVYSVAAQIGFTKEDKWCKMMVVGCAFATCVGVNCLPLSIMVIQGFGYYTEFSEGTVIFNAAQHIAYSMVLGILIMFGFLLFCRIVFRPNMGKLKDPNIDVGEAVQPFTRVQIFAIVLVLGMLVAMIAASLLPKAWGLTKLLASLNTVGIILVILIVTLFPKGKDGKNIFTYTKLSNEGVIWEVMFMVMCAITLGGALSSDAAGFKALAIEVLGPIMEGHGPFFLLALIAILTIIATNILNNAIVIVVMSTLSYPFVAAVGANPYVAITLIIFSANMGILLPSASPIGALLASNEWVDMKTILKYGIVGIVAELIILIAIGIPYGSIIYG